MSLKRRQSGSAAISSAEALESRQFLSATLVEITIPTPPTKPVVSKPHKTPAPKPKVVHKAVKPKASSGEQHTNIGYQIFAG